MLLREWNCRGVELSTDLQFVPRLRMHGSLPLLPIHFHSALLDQAQRKMCLCLTSPKIFGRMWNFMTWTLTAKKNVTDCGIGGRDSGSRVAWVFPHQHVHIEVLQELTQLWWNGIRIKSTKAWCWSLPPTAGRAYFDAQCKRLRPGPIPPGKCYRKHCERVSMQSLESTILTLIQLISLWWRIFEF
jgi:hypothetical protein